MKRRFQTFNFRIENTSSDAVDIYIDGEIIDASTQEIYKNWFGDETSVSYKSFRDALNKVAANTYNVYINSPGGLVSEAMAIHDLLIDLQAKGKTVNTIGRGIIASAATYILMAGKNSEMSANSWFMIHNVSGWAWGDVNAMENQVATMRKFNDTVRDFYATATGMRKEDITKMMNAETWMTAEDAKAKGFIQKVSSDAKFSNTINEDDWMFNNKNVLALYNSAVKGGSPNNQIDEMKKFFSDWGNRLMNAIKDTKAPENNDHAVLMESIGKAVSDAFNNGADGFEAAVNEVVAAAVKNTVEEATKPLNQKITDLEKANTDLGKKNEDLEKEFANLKGSETKPKNENEPAPIGSFKK